MIRYYEEKLAKLNKQIELAEKGAAMLAASYLAGMPAKIEYKDIVDLNDSLDELIVSVEDLKEERDRTASFLADELAKAEVKKDESV